MIYFLNITYTRMWDEYILNNGLITHMSVSGHRLSRTAPERKHLLSIPVSKMF